MIRVRRFLITALFVSVAGLAHAQTPGPPSNLTATINADTSITLQWTAPATGGAPTGYFVQIGTAPGANDVLNQQIGNVTTYLIVAGGFAPGTYYVRVRALNGTGVSAASNEVTLVVACTPPVQAPSSVTWRTSATAVQITWVPVASTTDYRVEIGTASGLSDVAVVTAGSSTRTFLTTALPAAGIYYGRVKATRACGAGPASEEVTIVAAAPVPSTTIVVNELSSFVELKNISNASLDVGGWRIQTTSGVDQVVALAATLPQGTTIAAGCTYLLAVAGTLTVTADQALSQSVDEGVAVIRTDGQVIDAAGRSNSVDIASPNTPYLEGTGLTPRAQSAGIQSFARAGDQDSNSNTADFIPLATANPQNSAACLASQPPGTPTNLIMAVSGSTVSLAWSAPTTGGSVNHYRLEAGTAPGASNAGLFDLGANPTSISFGSVADGTFYVRIRAVNNAGVSAASNEVVVVVCGAGCTTPPGAVTQLTFSVSNRNVLLQWTAPATGATPTGYLIEAGTGPGLTNIGQFPTGSTSAFVIVSSVPIGTYYVRVRAVSGGALGAVSNEVIIVVQ